VLLIEFSVLLEQLSVDAGVDVHNAMTPSVCDVCPFPLVANCQIKRCE
jgi:hypothetical protein